MQPGDTKGDTKTGKCSIKPKREGQS